MAQNQWQVVSEKPAPQNNSASSNNNWEVASEAPAPVAPKPTFWERLGFPAGSGTDASNVQPPPISASERNKPVDYAHPVRGDEGGGGAGDLLMHGLAEGSKGAGNFYVDQGPHQVVEGFKDLSHGNFAVGGHKIYSGGMTTALPLMPEVIAANPLMAARAIVGGTAVGKVAGLGAEAFDANPDQKQFAEDIGNLAGGALASGAFPRVNGTIKSIAKPFVKTALETAKATPVLGGTIKGITAFKDVPSEINNIWAGKTGDPQLDLFNSTPKLGDSPINTSFNAPSPVVQARTDPFVPSQMQPMPTRVASPSSFSGSNTTSKPLKASTPKTAQTEVLRNMGIAAPSATVKPMTRVPTATITPRPDLSFAGSNSGESAALNQLSENFSPDRLGINDLRGIAQTRGIKVEPGDNHQTLIGKIHDSMTPDELDQFEQAAQERMQPDYSIPATIAPPQ